MSQAPADVTRAIDDARAREAGGDWIGAIEMLEGGPSSGWTDRELAALRYRGGRLLLERPVRSAPCADGEAPPIGESGLREASLTELNAETLRGAILASGSVLVRNALSTQQVDALVAGIDASFDASAHPSEDPRHAHFAPLDLPAEEAAVLGRRWVQGAGGVLIADAPAALRHVLGLYRELGLHTIMSDYFGERPVLSAPKCTLRRVPLSTIGAWHQDGSFLGGQLRAVNVWLALTDCGVDAPGLDVVPRRFDEIADAGEGEWFHDWIVEEDSSRDALRPEFRAGDMLIFDEMMLHRSAVTEEMTKERHAIEFWCFGASSYPEGHVPIVW